MSETTGNRLRNSRACENCRASKSRCIYKIEPGICQRCELSGSKCIVRTKARPMRARAIQSSTAKSESGISNNPEFSIDLPSITSPETKEHLADLNGHHDAFFDEAGILATQPDQNPGGSGKTKSSAILEKRKISLAQAQSLLSSYFEKAPFFPFVRLAQDVTVHSLSKTSPFLLLAILTSASISDPKLYHQLDYQFKRILSSKVIIEGQKNLDFLQGLLVYIAWYPVHMNPKGNQSFMHMNLAISLAIDLGLDRETPNTSKFNSYDNTGLVINGMFTEAARRAYLGCYYISSALSMTDHKPNNLPHRTLMDTHGEILISDRKLIDVYAMCRLQMLLERISEASDPRRSTFDPQLSVFDSEVKVTVFLNELHEWQMSTPDEIKSLPFVAIAERFVRVSIYSHELGFLRRPYRDYISNMPNTVNTSHLVACLEAAKIFFEYLLALPQTSYVHFTVVQWGALVESIIVLSRLTFLMADTLGWDSETARCNVPLLMYLDALCYRFQTLSSTPDTSASSADQPLQIPPDPDILYVFKMVLGSVKRSYERRVGKIQPPTIIINDNNGARGPWTGHCPMLDPNLNAFFFDTPDFSQGQGYDMSGATPCDPGTDGLSHPDLWATMTGCWAGDFGELS